MEAENVAYAYTDEMALDDGVVVAVTRLDRVTGTVLTWLEQEIETWKSPARNWPVELLKYINADTPLEKALAAIAGLMTVKAPEARKIYEQNIGGGIWVRFYDAQKKELTGHEQGVESVRLWLMPNEMGGMTLMFPEDY